MSEWVSDIKLYFINAGIFAISMTDIEVIFKVVLLIVSIGYTINKWMLLRKDKKNK